MNRLFALGVASLSIGLLVAVSRGQEPTPPAPDEQKDPNVLRGPKVDEGERAKTIVKHDYAGKLVRLDVDPALAAMDLLELDEPTRDAAHAIILERDALVDRLVFDNLKPIAELAQARQAGDTQTVSRLVKELWDKSAAWRSRGRLVDELSRILLDDKAREMRELVDEYTKAALAERRRDQGDQPGMKGAIGAVAAEGLEGFGREIRRSYERVFLSQSKDFDALIAKLQLTPEQESKVRQVVGDLFQKTYGKPTKAQSAKVFLQVCAVLDPEQRRMLAETIAEDRRAEMRARKSSKPTPESAPEPKPDSMPAP